MTLISRSQILEANDLKTEDVSVPEWGGSVRVRSMTGRDRDAFGESLSKDANGNVDLTNYRAKLIAKCLVDESNNLMFSDDDIVQLGNKSAGAIATVFAVAERLNGIGSEGVEAIKKNSDSDLSESATTA